MARGRRQGPGSLPSQRGGRRHVGERVGEGRSSLSVERLWLPRGKRIQNEQVMLEPFGESSLGAEGIYRILNDLLTDYPLITKGN